MTAQARTAIAALLDGYDESELLNEMVRHERGTLNRQRPTLANELRDARDKGNLHGPLILALEHVVPHSAQTLLHHYRHLKAHSHSKSYIRLVNLINDSLRACPRCEWTPDRELVAERFRASVELNYALHASAPRSKPEEWAPTGIAGRRLTVTTGVSGLALDRALAKLANNNPPRAIVDVDAHFVCLTDYFLGRLGLYEKWKHQPPLQRAFRLNAQILQDCWRLAFRSAVRGAPVGIPEVDTQLGTLPTLVKSIRASDVILSTRATWYDRLSHGFLVAADVREFAALMHLDCAKRLVVFTDDLTDVCARLIGLGMYRHLVRDPTARVTDDLLKILEWRRSEVLVSETIAQALDTDMIIAPMKLPVVTVDRLLDGRREDVVYLSYSATHPYRDTTTNPVEQEEWPQYVIDVSRAITATTDLAVIDATAVDEYRVETAREALRSRWPVRSGDENLLAADLSQEERSYAERPFARRKDRAADRATLRRQLYDLVQARGRALARQAGALVLLRPFASAGTLATGMDIVSDQNRRLVQYVEELPSGLGGTPLMHAPAVVFHTREDEWQRRCALVTAHCLDVLDQYANVFPALSDPQRLAFAEQMARHANEFDAWSAAPTHELGAQVQRIYRTVARSNGRTVGLGDRLGEFDAAIAAQFSASLLVTEHEPRSASDDDEPGVPAFRRAVFVIADTWQRVEPKTLAAALGEAVARARARELGMCVLRRTTMEWHPRADNSTIDWSLISRT